MESVNKYLMSINHFSRSRELFEIEAANKAEAVEKAKQDARKNPHYWGGNWNFDSIKCIKKIQK